MKATIKWWFTPYDKEKLSTFLRKKRMTQEELGRKLGYRKENFSAIVNGRRSVPENFKLYLERIGF